VGAAIRRTSHLDEETLDIDARSIKIENRSFREKPFKTMYVCLAHNVDVVAFSSTHKLWDESFYYDTIILCEIRLYSDGTSSG